MRKSTVAFPVASALVACALFLAASRAVVAEDRAVTVDGTGTSGQAAQTGSNGAGSAAGSAAGSQGPGGSVGGGAFAHIQFARDPAFF